MTKNYELDCRDLFECQHALEIAIGDNDGKILYWRCRCGKKTWYPPESTNEDRAHLQR